MFFCCCIILFLTTSEKIFHNLYLMYNIFGISEAPLQINSLEEKPPADRLNTAMHLALRNRKEALRKLNKESGYQESQGNKNQIQVNTMQSESGIFANLNEIPIVVENIEQYHVASNGHSPTNAAEEYPEGDKTPDGDKTSNGLL